MFSVTRQEPAEDSLLKTYRGGPHPERWGRYGDCFSIMIDRPVTLADFVYAFYTSPVFRLERWLLGLAGAGASNADARDLAEGRGETFAVWSVAQRGTDQLLMGDRYQRTRSWFQVRPLAGERTLLLFGSAVAASAGTNNSRRSPLFRALLIFHVAYSQLLLHSAQRRALRVSLAHDKS